MILTNDILATPEVIRNLGMRFRDYRMRMKMTRKDVAEAAGVGLTTLYKFEAGKMTDISLRTLLRLLRAIRLFANWDQLIPELPESPYLYDDKGVKKQRIRHKKGQSGK